MARDPNKFREDEDLNETDDKEDAEEDFDGRPEQSGDEDDSAGMEDESAEPLQAGRQGAKSSSGRRGN